MFFLAVVPALLGAESRNAYPRFVKPQISLTGLRKILHTPPATRRSYRKFGREMFWNRNPILPFERKQQRTDFPFPSTIGD